MTSSPVRTIPTSTPWIAVDDGHIVSAHDHPSDVPAGMMRATLPEGTIGRTFRVGDRVTVQDGTVRHRLAGE